MGGIRRSTVHFEQLPSKNEFKKRLTELTGLALGYEEEFEGVLEAFYLTRPEVAVSIHWVDKDVSRVLEALKAAGINDDRTTNFHEKRSRCIHVVFAAGNVDYLERSALYLLKELGGRSENESTLPTWAGKKWVDVWPRTKWGQIKARWYGWCYGTLPG